MVSSSKVKVPVTVSPKFDSVVDVAAVIGSDIVKVIFESLKMGRVPLSSIEAETIEGGVKSVVMPSLVAASPVYQLYPLLLRIHNK